MSLSGGGMCVTVDAMETLKKIGELYGMYSSCEEMRDTRVMYEEEPVPSLVIQEDISYHGSPYWKTVRTLTTDPDRIKWYRTFEEILDYINGVEREVDRAPVPPSFQQKDPHLKKKGHDAHER